MNLRITIQHLNAALEKLDENHPSVPNIRQAIDELQRVRERRQRFYQENRESECRRKRVAYAMKVTL